ncbi:hypothetical protein J3A83DRAFT_2691012 [Scleroderma citrinum]
MASAEEVNLSPPHAPHERAVEAFNHVLDTIKHEVKKSRYDWNKHEPRMWDRAGGLSDHDLVNFRVEEDLVEIRTGTVSYGTLIFGKIRIPAVNDDLGEGFIHVRCVDYAAVSVNPDSLRSYVFYHFFISMNRIHDPPNKGEEDVMFHSIFTKEGERDADGHPHLWRAIQTRDEPLEFFNE